MIIDAVIDEPDVNYYSIDWHFEGLSVQEHNALNITLEEDKEIFEQLSEAAYSDRMSSYDEFCR
ncbi:MAG: hypothetical protein JSR89_18005 [Proteobacteria bacterium]|nr:hypothetical protein [Pseudomonadota bacterium]